jgi:hypothetical protein
LVAEEAVKRKLAPRVGRETIRILYSATTSSRGGKKMWVVAELDDDYIAKMEDVLETYEQAYEQEPVVCLDEKPVTLHADVRLSSPAQPGREARNVFCAVERKSGSAFHVPHARSFGL